MSHHTRVYGYGYSRGGGLGAMGIGMGFNRALMVTVGEIKSLRELATACRKMGMEFIRNRTDARITNHKTIKCDHAIEVPASSHDIGVKKMSNGSFTLTFDRSGAEGGKIESECGEKLKKLLQRYQVAIVEKYAETEGLQVEKEKVKGGKTRLKLYRTV